MCGIAGYISRKQYDEKLLRTMIDTIYYRGPDDEGFYIENNEQYQVGFAHKRLSILDLSACGHQPMHFDNLTIVYNGEVYNFKEIQEDLEKVGYTFESKSDTEVVLKAFHKWGVDSVNRLNGMFGIAIWDKNTNKLYLIRDRMGIKPLYYFFDGSNFVFASELKPIMKYPEFNKNIDKNLIYTYLVHGYITAPYTIFKNTYKLEPGNYLVFRNNNIDIQEYWSIRQAYLKREIDENQTEKQYIENLEILIQDSIRYRMISDVPIGSFLSGGYDSSLVTAVMQSLSETKIDSFSIGFKEDKYNEATYAKEVAKYLNTNHHELYLSIKKSKELIHEIPKYYDEPFADSSQIPTMLVSDFAKKNITVALSGDGGDELFCGYDTYDGDLRYQKNYKKISKLLRHVGEFIDLKPLLGKINRKFVKLGEMFNDDNIVNSQCLYSRYYLEKLIKGYNYFIVDKYFDILKLSSNIQEKHMLKDLINYLPSDILTKVDRASMAVSLETRVPLLDQRIVEYSFSIPHNLKYYKGNKKYILKKLVYKYIPKELMERPKKGFDIPVYQWLHTDLNYLINKYLSIDFINKQGIFYSNTIKKLMYGFNKERGAQYFHMIIWHLIVFQMWYEEYIH